MVKANELRLGNRVSVFFDVVSILAIGDDGILDTTAYFDGLKGCCGCTEDMAEPIPLTSEWMERLGHPSASFAGNFHLWIRHDGAYLEQYNEGEEKLPHIQYVHQLQNLFFALTGEELTIKP